MGRRLFILCSALSLLLCVAAGALWVRSYWLSDLIVWRYAGGVQLGQTARGNVVVELFSFAGNRRAKPGDRSRLQDQRTEAGAPVNSLLDLDHAHVLEAIADLAAAGGYLGALSLTLDMPEVQQFRAATNYVLERTPDRKSIVCSSILSALEGRFGDYHATRQTEGSELFINPLMPLYWCFRLNAVARRILYLDRIAGTEEYMELATAIQRFQVGLPAIRPSRTMPI